MKEDNIRKRETFNKYLEILEADSNRLFDKKDFIVINCPACRGEDYARIFGKMGFEYVQCKQCETIYVNPRPRISTLEKFYVDSEATKYWVNEFFLPVLEKRREKIFAPRALEIAKQFPEYKSGKIGDVGAGFGVFLEELKKVWPKALMVAIEPSLEMTNICRKKDIEVIPTILERVDSSHYNSFDLLVSFELYEHLYNPEDFLFHVKKLLKPNGVFVFTTLNGCGFDLEILGKHSKSFSPPQHLNFFNTKSIELLLREVGFIIEGISTPGKLDWDIVEGMILNEGIEVEPFWRTVMGLPNQAKIEFQNWIAENELSSHMKVTVRKGE